MNTSSNPRKRALVIGLILVGSIIVGIFGLRTIRAFREFRGHRPPPPSAAEEIETDVSLIRDWMTIPYISKMYLVPPRILFKALEIPEHKNKEKSLRQLNEEYYPQAKGIVLEKVKATILANPPQPMPTVPDTPVVP
ncbi:MAG: hypothetical protein EHM33_14620 [Chloroflexi bacterium]|nr:MAG: hypothetical protein EHM33_14620 [Chloroflexota bacterium]